MKRVLLYGDSNTYGIGPMPNLSSDVVLGEDARWGAHLAHSLGPDWQVIVEGLPGRTTVFDDPIEGSYRNGLTVLPAILHSHAPIDVLVICLGTNDQKARFGLQAVDVALGIARLVKDAFASGIVGQILVICPPPLLERNDFSEVFKGAETRGAGLAAFAERFAREAGASFLDAGLVIEVDPTDGIHWSAASHRALGPAVAKVIEEM